MQERAGGRKEGRKEGRWSVLLCSPGFVTRRGNARKDSDCGVNGERAGFMVR